jgi:hypothetical protein
MRMMFGRETIMMTTTIYGVCCSVVVFSSSTSTEHVVWLQQKEKMKGEAKAIVVTEGIFARFVGVSHCFSF